MASPLKTASTILFQKHLSPKSSNIILSPSRKYICHNYPSNKLLQTFPEHHEAKKINHQNVSPTNSLVLDSPQKRSLLKFGLNQKDLLFVLGKGSFGTVVKAQYKKNIVALKSIKVKTSQLKEINECNARNLIHRNIVKILNILISENYCLVIMEYCKNSKNLQKLLDDLETSLDEKTVICYTRHIAEGLRYCHENCVLHLDLKPTNILLCDNNICKICDFGNSVNEFHIENYEYRGTIAYTAPELLRGCKPTSKCDIYSLGIVLWQLLSNKSLYEYLEKEVVIYKVVKFNFRPSLLNFTNKDLASLCANCWNENANKRPNCSKICNLLDQFYFE